MTEQLISFETAKLAKEKGFTGNHSGYSWYVFEKWDKSGRTKPILIDPINFDVEYEQNKYKGNIYHYLDCPPQSVLQKWLREIYNIEMMISTHGPIGEKKYVCILPRCYTPNNSGVVTQYYDTYEGALEAGLTEGLKLINKEN